METKLLFGFALFFSSLTGYGQLPPPLPPPPPYVIFTEIMHNSPEDMDSLNFLEIRFGGWPATTPLDSFSFSENIDFQFHDTLVPSSGYILLAQDSIAFSQVYGITVFEWGENTDVDLSEPFIIYGYSHTYDSVNLNGSLPMLEPANGNGYSLKRCWDGSSILFEPSTVSTGIEINGTMIYADPDTFEGWDCTTVNVQPIQQAKNLTLYPNPNSGTFTIDFSPLQHTATLRIRNTLSQILFERQVDRGSTTLTENIKFNKGIYLLELDDGNNCQHANMVVTD
jgi:hypothetical protein